MYMYTHTCSKWIWICAGGGTGEQAIGSPGVGYQGSGCTGNALCHGNEGLLYLGIDLRVPSKGEEVTTMGTHVSCSRKQLGAVLGGRRERGIKPASLTRKREREREREGETERERESLYLHVHVPQGSLASWC